MGSERAASIITYLRDAYPGTPLPPGTLRRTAFAFGVSPERVRQLARKAGLESAPRRRMVMPVAPASCQCGREIPAHRRYCSACRYVSLECCVCGRDFLRERSNAPSSVSSAAVYCSRRCYGRMVGRTYGFGSERRRPREAVQV